MDMFATLVMLGLVAGAHCLPPPSPRSSSGGLSDPHDTTVDHRLDMLRLSRRLSAAVAPLLDVFLAPIVESLPDGYLESLADSVKKEKFASPGPDFLTHDVQYFKDEEELQDHQDFISNIISKND